MRYLVNKQFVVMNVVLPHLAVRREVPHHDGGVHGGGHHPLLVGAEMYRGDGISVSLELLVKLWIRHCKH